MASKKVLVNFDFSKNEIQNAVMQNLASAPSSPVEGQMYYDTVLHQFGVYQNAAWAYHADKAFLLARANHTGTQLAATISDFNTAVRTNSLDQLTAAAADVSLNTHKLTNVVDPTNPQDAATKKYVDLVAQGMTQKPTAMVATTGALPANTYANGSSGVGATLTASSVGILAVDGYNTVLNDLILVKNEAAPANNGLYQVTTAGTAGVAYVLTRHVDMDQAAEFIGAFIPVGDFGSTLLNTLWLCSTIAAVTVGTTAITFTQLAAPTSYTAGNGLQLAATTFSLKVPASSGLVADGTGTYIDTALVVKKYAVSIGDGSSTSLTVTHNLNTKDIHAAIYDNTTPFAEVMCDVQHATVNTTLFIFATAPTTNQFRVVIHG